VLTVSEGFDPTCCAGVNTMGEADPIESFAAAPFGDPDL